MTRTLLLLALMLTPVGSAYSAVLVDFTSWGGGNTQLDEDPLGWILTVNMNGDGTVSVTSNNPDVGVDGTGGATSIAVTGTTTSTATGSFTITLDGIEGTSGNGNDTNVQIRGSGLGVVGRNSGRLDWNPGQGDDSEVIDITVDTASLAGGSGVVLTEYTFGNYQTATEPILTDFDSSATTLAGGAASATLGGDGYTVASGGTAVAFLQASNAGGTGLQGYAVTTLSFDVVDLVPEPSSLGLALLGAVALVKRRR